MANESLLAIRLSPDAPLEAALLVEHQPVELVCDAPAGGSLALAVDGQPLEPFLRPGDARWRWRWNPGPAVGLHHATLTINTPEGSRQHTTLLRVAPRKLDQEHYEALLEDVQRLAYNLAVTLSGAGAEGAALQRDAPWQRSRLEEYYALFEARLDAFVRATRRIAQRPREQLRGTTADLPLSQAAGLGPDALANLARGTFDEAPADVATELQEALRPGGGLLPRSVPAPRSSISYDIYEHRLLKQLLATLGRRARFIGRLSEQEAARLESSMLADAWSSRLARARQITDGCAAAARTLQELRGLPFLADVQPLPAFRGATPLLQRDPAYREVYRMWQALRQHPYLAFDTPLCAIPITDLPRLYEGWCALQTVQALLSLGGTVREQRLVTVGSADPNDKLVASVVLVEDAPLLVIARGDTMLTLRYQARYRPPGEQRTKSKEQSAEDEEQRTKSGESGTNQPSAGSRFSVLGSASSVLGSLDRYTHVPDLAIEIERPGMGQQVLLLDAKYRLDASGRDVPPDALADAYTYLGAIGSAGQRATVGALLLYPGRAGVALYASGVGSVPLVPGDTDELARVLAQFLE